ncbi:hypothetical protein KUV47_20310 [Vannielia litorea]|uniref:hypothetical protein n=1 Tax=Vannielia litorea TaxID=1217970 RepID=UPI001C984FCE|nr:hypothetical protein [Vannielia litorea]MBY6155573.1 hypothetical protein [Vannielia litorea]
MSALAPHKVGPWGELSALDNPGGLVLVPIPSFAEVMTLVNKGDGPLTEAEFDTAKARAVTIALPTAEAEEFLAPRGPDTETYGDYLAAYAARTAG